VLAVVEILDLQVLSLLVVSVVVLLVVSKDPTMVDAVEVSLEYSAVLQFSQMLY
tara:strand:+ start:318 stop:479 length:162 start_codon:yes stop_codon:yes gene_type:complete